MFATLDRPGVVRSSLPVVSLGHRLPLSIPPLSFPRLWRRSVRLGFLFVFVFRLIYKPESCQWWRFQGYP